MEQPNLRAILHKHLDVDPGPAPKGVVPVQIEDNERPYIDQLIAIFSKHSGMEFSNEEDVAEHEFYAADLKDQRRRYHDAESFRRHFRDNIAQDVLERFDTDIYDGVVDEYRATDG